MGAGVGVRRASRPSSHASVHSAAAIRIEISGHVSRRPPRGNGTNARPPFASARLDRKTGPPPARSLLLAAVVVVASVSSSSRRIHRRRVLRRRPSRRRGGGGVGGWCASSLSRSRIRHPADARLASRSALALARGVPASWRPDVPTSWRRTGVGRLLDQRAPRPPARAARSELLRGRSVGRSVALSSSSASASSSPSRLTRATTKALIATRGASVARRFFCVGSHRKASLRPNPAPPEPLRTTTATTAATAGGRGLLRGLSTGRGRWSRFDGGRLNSNQPRCNQPRDRRPCSRFLPTPPGGARQTSSLRLLRSSLASPVPTIPF